MHKMKIIVDVNKFRYYRKIRSATLKANRISLFAFYLLRQILSMSCPTIETIRACVPTLNFLVILDFSNEASQPRAENIQSKICHLPRYSGHTCGSSIIGTKVEGLQVQSSAWSTKKVPPQNLKTNKCLFKRGVTLWKNTPEFDPQYHLRKFLQHERTRIPHFRLQSWDKMDCYLIHWF